MPGGRARPPQRLGLRGAGSRASGGQASQVPSLVCEDIREPDQVGKLVLDVASPTGSKAGS
jgi:hypothetical protein